LLGHAGLGFAVVADEVRNLSQRVAGAAQETGLLVRESTASSEKGVSGLQRVTELFRNITDS